VMNCPEADSFVFALETFEAWEDWVDQHKNQHSIRRCRLPTLPIAARYLIVVFLSLSLYRHPRDLVQQELDFKCIQFYDRLGWSCRVTGGREGYRFTESELLGGAYAMTKVCFPDGAWVSDLLVRSSWYNATYTNEQLKRINNFVTY